jgi:hypothetical protein
MFCGLILIVMLQHCITEKNLLNTHQNFMNTAEAQKHFKGIENIAKTRKP